MNYPTDEQIRNIARNFAIDPDAFYGAILMIKSFNTSYLPKTHPKFFPFHSGADDLPLPSLMLVKAIETALLRFDLLSRNRMHDAADPGVGFDELKSALHTFLAASRSSTPSPDAQDAARYRWIRGIADDGNVMVVETMLSATDLDQTVDAGIDADQARGAEITALLQQGAAS